jgi:hypothetical protein
MTAGVSLSLLVVAWTVVQRLAKMRERLLRNPTTPTAPPSTSNTAESGRSSKYAPSSLRQRVRRSLPGGTSSMDRQTAQVVTQCLLYGIFSFNGSIWNLAVNLVEIRDQEMRMGGELYWVRTDLTLH